MRREITRTIFFVNRVSCGKINTSECLLFNAKWSFVQLYYKENKSPFENMMMSALN